MEILISNRDVFALNKNTKKMEIIKTGSVIKYRSRKENNYIILKDKVLYEVTADIFNEFFGV